eukprot:5381011-Amphidinium_carterae.1
MSGNAISREVHVIVLITGLPSLLAVSSKVDGQLLSCNAPAAQSWVRGSLVTSACMAGAS